MKELWKNEKSKAGITLGLWLVFIFFILLLASCGSSNKKTEPDKATNVTHKLEVLLNSNNGFKMTIETKDLSEKRVYDSSFTDKDTFEGYVEDKSGINRFRCDTTCYKVFLDHEEEEALYYEELVKTIKKLRTIIPNLITEKDKFYYEDEDKTSIYVNDECIINKIIIEQEEKNITFDINYNN